MKIAHFLGTFKKEDGVTRVVLSLIDQAQKKGLDTIIVTGWAEDESITSSVERIASAIGRSNDAPSFFMSAGAKLTIIFLAGKENPEFFIAALILSRDSLIAISGNPTILNPGRPEPISTSAVTS